MVFKVTICRVNVNRDLRGFRLEKDIRLQDVTLEVLSEVSYTFESAESFNPCIDASISMQFKAKITEHESLAGLEVVVSRVFDRPLRNPTNWYDLNRGSSCVVSGVLEPVHKEGTDLILFNRIIASEVTGSNTVSLGDRTILKEFKV